MTLDSIGDGVIATDTYGRVTFINHVAESLTGWTSADAVGASLAEVFQIVHEGTGELVENPVDRVLREKVQVSAAYHVELVARDGARKPIEDKAAPIWDDQGTFVGVVLIFRDSSQRRRTEQRQAAQLAVTSILAESGGFDHAAPRLLGAIGENTGWDVGLLWGVDPTGDRMSCHAGWYAPAVTVTEPAIASAGMTIARGESLPGRVLETGRPDWTVELDRDDDFERHSAAAHLELHTAFAFPISDTGRVVAVMEFLSGRVCARDEVLLEMMAAVGRQIGQFIERRRAEQELRNSESRLRRLVESNIIGVNFAMGDQITDANDAYLQMVGYSREDVLAGRLNWRSMTPPEHHHLDDQAIEELRATKACTPFEKEYFRKDGSRVPVLIGVAELNSEPPAWISFILDLTDRNRLEEQLRESGHPVGGGKPPQG